MHDVELQLLRFRHRVQVALVVVLLALGLLGLRMYVLQIQRHADLQGRAESNRTAVLPLPPLRGNIVDRHGVVLADNQAVFTLEITPALAGDLEQTLAAVAELIPITPRELRRFQRLRAESHRFDSLPLRTRLTAEEMPLIAAQLFRLPGVSIQARHLRHYPLGATAVHVVGHVGRINQRDQERMAEWPPERRANYRGTDHLGKLGVEQSHEQSLHGTTGFKRVEINSHGQAVRTLETVAAQPGHTLRLTIDARLQHLVEQLFGQRRGALVAIDPRNGEILAFVSLPTFDPNLFVDGIGTEDWRALNESIERPMHNRALRGTYPPGSTFKPFMALAGLELGLRRPDSVVYDPGFWVLGNQRFRSVGERHLGQVDLRRAMAVSSNVYFYTLAHEMGIEAMHDFMRPLGFGQPSGIDLVGESRGLLPNQAWKRSAYRNPAQQRWFVGDTVAVGIGQGYKSATMLQLASATATLASGGVRQRPHLGLRVYDPRAPRGRALFEPEGHALNLNPAHLQAVLDSMEAVNVEGGTAARVFAGAPYRSGGKTGTAQAVRIAQGQRYDAAQLEEYQRSHSLYIGFAPLEAPTVALAVIVENAGFGSVAAAPIARRVFDYLLLGLYPSEQDIAATQQGQSGPPIGVQRQAREVVWQGRP
ncbi:cell division protein FtsI/penicillin-binding protein 2 [Serpentinimonas raichei]|uniref:Peptidoglycan D,D-transpeptidase MrdA n=1 Tax=Serpentinimonas raichei TaxID=1458425 RepID=A0A060NRS7_9BURK|nr:penicillin-binding protein 2 [Serpentinimonas raichei]BAO81614.1 cell division protein FtsI/penicillin-binding protein 2 [Serpentinimonas raichei]